MHRGGGRCEQAGSVSPVVLLILALLVGLFVFAAVAGARGGLSSGGCLPTRPADREALGKRWFAPSPPEARHVHASCPLVGTTLKVKAACVVTVDATGPEPAHWWQKIAAAFRDRPRRLSVTATTRLEMDVDDHGKDAARVKATLEEAKSTDVTISRAGATLTLTCAPGCDVLLSPPAPRES